MADVTQRKDLASYCELFCKLSNVSENHTAHEKKCTITRLLNIVVVPHVKSPLSKFDNSY